MKRPRLRGLSWSALVRASNNFWSISALFRKTSAGRSNRGFYLGKVMSSKAVQQLICIGSVRALAAQEKLRFISRSPFEH